MIHFPYRISSKTDEDDDDDDDDDDDYVCVNAFDLCVVMRRTTTTRYFLISFYLSPSLRVTCIILRFFLMVLAVVCTIPILFFLSLSLPLARSLTFYFPFSLLFPSLTQFSSVRTSLHHCADFRHSHRWAILDVCVCVYVYSLEDCFFPKLLHVYTRKPCVL